MRSKLTDTTARQAKPKEKAYKLADQGGLYLLVKPNGSKLWRYKYRIGGVERLLALGAFPEIGLAQVRNIHRDARGLVANVIDPSAKKRADRSTKLTDSANTFLSVAEQWINDKRKQWSPAYLNQVKTYLVNDVYPTVGNLPVKQVTTAYLFAILKRVEQRGATAAATFVRGWCFAIFRYAIQRGLADQNPARELGDAVNRKKVKHKRALSRQEIGKLLGQLSESKSTSHVQSALRLLMLTFVRPSELRNAKWSEFDLKKARWEIPADRMKMRERHVVPLSRQALSLLERLKEQSLPSRTQLFPNMRDPKRNMSITTLNRMLERLGWAGTFSAHGFRATASTFFNEHESRYRPEAIERQLAHREPNAVRKAYNHAQYLEERSQMMQDWADYLDSTHTSKSH